ncbi:MAG: riboflavin kinase / adenylyltransferase [Solirubrobacteraceae bacterium]|jgi:riboflavin kinase/FMN adenylyltransferase|nr:riboflavin kinase / adenylyltransferase [Solirubrobacteraceae bacterium]
MRLTPLPEVEPRPRRIAVGEFDGVHVGHREVIRGSDTVLTFEPHPLRVVRPEAAPKLLTSLEAKAELIAELGVQELVVIPFDEGFANQTPEAFIDEVLVSRLAATHVSVGENFRFGHGAAGDPALLAADGRFETRVVDLIEIDGEVISSSHVRALVLAGDVRAAARLLGAPFRLRGTVVPGDRRGRELGFPTANVVPDEALVCPGHGVYAARAGGDAAAVNVGVRPTFGTGRAVLVEAYLIDRDVDLYGQVLTIEFLDRLRGERRFDSVEALIAQMKVDVEQARAICGH